MRGILKILMNAIIRLRNSLNNNHAFVLKYPVIVLVLLLNLVAVVEIKIIRMESFSKSSKCKTTLMTSLTHFNYPIAVDQY